MDPYNANLLTLEALVALVGRAAWAGVAAGPPRIERVRGAGASAAPATAGAALVVRLFLVLLADGV